MLAGSAVVDYDIRNVAAYAKQLDDVPLAPILYAPYLEPVDPIPLEKRPIDLLFIGSMNPRRRDWLGRIERTGRKVALFDAPLYGVERDRVIQQAKAVVNVHFYESAVVEQARVSHSLSLGTPVISERTPQTDPPPAFEDSVLWLPDDELDGFFAEGFDTPAYHEAVRSGLARFHETDPINEYGGRRGSTWARARTISPVG